MLAGVVAARVVAIIVEEVDGYMLLGQVVEELRVYVELAVGVYGVDVVDGKSFLFVHVLEVNCVLFTPEPSATEDIIVLSHISAPA